MTMWVPTFAVSALKGLSGSKVKEISFRPTFKESALTEVPITGSTKAVALATQLIKMAVLYAQAGDKPPPREYLKDKKAETVFSHPALEVTDTQEKVRFKQIWLRTLKTSTFQIKEFTSTVTFSDITEHNDQHGQALPVRRQGARHLRVPEDQEAEALGEPHEQCGGHSSRHQNTKVVISHKELTDNY